MHFHCVQCSFDFCGGCKSQFVPGSVSKNLTQLTKKLIPNYDSNVMGPSTVRS